MVLLGFCCCCLALLKCKHAGGHNIQTFSLFEKEGTQQILISGFLVESGSPTHKYRGFLSLALNRTAWRCDEMFVLQPCSVYLYSASHQPHPFIPLCCSCLSEIQESLKSNGKHQCTRPVSFFSEHVLPQSYPLYSPTLLKCLSGISKFIRSTKNS